MHRIGIGHNMSYNRMAGLVVCSNLFFFIRNDAAFALRPHQHLFNAWQYLFQPNVFFISASGKDSGFIEEIFKVCAGKARRPFRNAA